MSTRKQDQTKTIKRSFAFIIANGNRDILQEIQEVQKFLHLMDMRVAVLYNKTANDFKEHLEELIHVNPSSVLDILIIIHSMHGYNFKTSDEELHLYRDVLHQLARVDGFDEILKIIIANNSPNTVRFNTTDSVNELQVGWGRGLRYIASYKTSNFIMNLLEQILKHEGNVRDAVNELKDRHEIHDILTSGNLPLRSFSSQHLLGEPR